MKNGVDWTKAKKLVADASERTIRAASIALFKAIITDTPVITGRLRGNWQASIGQPIGIEVPFTDKSGSTTVSKATGVANRFRVGEHLFLTNNVEYAEKIERGVPTGQRPQGMVAVNTAKFAALIERIARSNKT
jgi:hypothetical protein